MPVTTRMTTIQVVAEKNSLRASELSRIAGRREQISEPAHRLDDVDAELFSDAADEYLYRVGVAIEILIVQMLDQLAARNYAAGMVHEVGKQAIFVRRELDRISFDRHPASAGIEANLPT